MQGTSEVILLTFSAEVVYFEFDFQGVNDVALKRLVYSDLCLNFNEQCKQILG